MSVNRNENIIKVVRGDNGIGPVRYNFSASLVTIGAGGGGQSGIDTGANGIAGGGGGGGAVVSASVSVVPNVTWGILAGEGGTFDTDGAFSEVIAYDNDYNGLITMRAGGGTSPTNSGGGNSGTGSVETNTATSSYAGFTGGAIDFGVAGGGASHHENGGDGVPFDGNPSSGTGGPGGDGQQTTPSAFWDDPLAAGGGGGVTPNNLIGGTGGNDGGGNGGFVGNDPGGNGLPATSYGSGGGGGGADGANGRPGGAGFNGTVGIYFSGSIGTQHLQYDIALTNASASYDAGTDHTTIFFQPGIGTFRYTAPFPYVPGN